MMLFFIVSFFVLIGVGMPADVYAWGPGVHLNIAANIIDPIKIISSGVGYVLLNNLDEFFYGALAPDFIIGKKYTKQSRHSHNWDIAFDMLKCADTDKEKAFSYGYISHLSADAIAHSMMIPSMVEKSKMRSVKHLYIETFADICCGSEYKNVAAAILKKHNKYLDVELKSRVDSVIFSFGVSKILFKASTKMSFSKGVNSFMLKAKFAEIAALNKKMVEGYLDISKEVSIDAIINLKNAPITRVSAIDR